MPIRIKRGPFNHPAPNYDAPSTRWYIHRRGRGWLTPSMPGTMSGEQQQQQHLCCTVAGQPRRRMSNKQKNTCRFESKGVRPITRRPTMMHLVPGGMFTAAPGEGGGDGAYCRQCSRYPAALPLQYTSSFGVRQGDNQPRGGWKKTKTRTDFKNRR